STTGGNDDSPSTANPTTGNNDDDQPAGNPQSGTNSTGGSEDSANDPASSNSVDDRLDNAQPDSASTVGSNNQDESWLGDSENDNDQPRDANDTGTLVTNTDEPENSDDGDTNSTETESPLDDAENVGTDMPFSNGMPSPQDLAAIEAALNATEADLLVASNDSPEIRSRTTAEFAPPNITTSNTLSGQESTGQNSRYTLAQSSGNNTVDTLAKVSDSTDNIDFGDEAAAANPKESSGPCNDQAGATLSDGGNCCPSNKVTQLVGVYFETGKADLTEVARRELDKAANNLALCEGQSFEIAGHTDARASESYNLSLSQARAEAVRSYLIRKGVNPSQLTAKGYGETQPLNPDKSDKEALNENRRVELRPINYDAVGSDKSA
ncbi:OmpA family protein, partial [Zhongshania sp.]